MYGDTTAGIRDNLRALLLTRSTPAVTGPKVAAVARYRNAVLTWCRQAAYEVTQIRPLEEDLTPSEVLRDRLMNTAEYLVPGRPRLEEYTEPTDNQVMEHWRLAAKAAAIGERDFGAGVTRSRLSEEQCQAVMSDVATTVLAIDRLEHAYPDVSARYPLIEPALLRRDAADTAAWLLNNHVDHSVDGRGAQPIPGAPRRELPAGMHGVVSAVEQLGEDLRRLPTVDSLRTLVLEVQGVTAAVAEATNSERGAKSSWWSHKANRYRKAWALLGEVGGRVGDGHSAPATSAALHDLVAALGHEDLRENHPRLREALVSLDRRLTRVITHGQAHALYHRRHTLDRLDERSTGLIKKASIGYSPLTDVAGQELVAKLTKCLEHQPAPQAVQPVAPGRNRFNQALYSRRVTTRLDGLGVGG